MPVNKDLVLGFGKIVYVVLYCLQNVGFVCGVVVGWWMMVVGWWVMDWDVGWWMMGGGVDESKD